MARNSERPADFVTNARWFSLPVEIMLRAFFSRAHWRDRRPANECESTQAGILAQYHAAEYASERNSVDVWKTLQYAMIPIIFVSWSLLVQIRGAINSVFFCWACAVVVPLCFLAYQRAMVDALTGVLLIEEHVRPLAVKLAGSDKFWFHEPIYRKEVKPDFAYGWIWPPLSSFVSAFAGLVYQAVEAHSFNGDWWCRLVAYGDIVGYIVCCFLAWQVGKLSKEGLALNRKIDARIRGHHLSWF